MTEENELITVQQDDSIAYLTEDIMISAEKRIAQFNKLIAISISATTKHDWVDQNGKPYLQSSGAEKVARLWGVSWSLKKPEKTPSSDDKGPFYFYVTEGSFSLKNDRITTIGTCSSRDKFFTTKKGEALPMSEVDETDIYKKSQTNCVVNGITKLLGLRGLTWEQVNGAGIDKNKIQKVAYKISEAQRKRIFALMKGAEKTEEQLKQYLINTFQIETTNDITTANYEQICNWIEGKK